MIKNCKICSKEFNARLSKYLYCSKVCRDSSKTFAIPAKKDLEKMYLADKLTLEKIGKFYKVQQKLVGRWLKKYNISIRPKGIGFKARGLQVPTKKELNKMVHVEFLSLRKIGEKFGCDKGTVSGWLKKYQIEPPNAGVAKTKGNSKKITETELRQMYEVERLSTTEIAKYYGVSAVCVTSRLNKFEIKIRKSGWGETFQSKLGYIVRSIYEKRVSDWLINHNIEHEYEPNLPFSNLYKSDFLVNGYYIEVWGVTNSFTYNERKNRKIELYRKNSLPLIQIPVEYFYKENKGLWQKVLAKHLL